MFSTKILLTKAEYLETKYWVYFVEEDRDSHSQTCRWEIGKFHSTSSFTSKGEEWTIMFRAQKKNTSESFMEPLLAWEPCPEDDRLLAYERLAMRLQHQLQVIEHLRKPYENVERSMRCLDVHSWIDNHFYVRTAADWSHMDMSLQERLHPEEEDIIAKDRAMLDAEKFRMEHIIGRPFPRLRLICADANEIQGLVKRLQSIVNLGKVKYRIINEVGWNLSFYRLEIRYRDDPKKDDLTYCTRRFTTLKDCLFDAIKNLNQDICQAEHIYEYNGSRRPSLDQVQRHSSSSWNESSESIEELVNLLCTLPSQYTHSQVPTGEHSTYQKTGESSNERSASASSSNFASDAETTMMQCMANLQLHKDSSNPGNNHHFHSQHNATEDYSQHHRPETIRSTLTHDPIHHTKGRKSASATSHTNIPNSTTLVRCDIPKLPTDPAVPNGRHRLARAPIEHGKPPFKVPHSGEDGYETDIEPVMFSSPSSMEVVQYHREGEGPGSALAVYSSEAETLHGNWDSGFESGVEGAF